MAVLALLLAGMLPTLAAPAGSAEPGAAQASPVVISEFRTRGPNGGNDEFVELYNRSPLAVDLSGSTLYASSDTGGTGRRLTIELSLGAAGAAADQADDPPVSEEDLLTLVKETFDAREVQAGGEEDR